VGPVPIQYATSHTGICNIKQLDEALIHEHRRPLTAPARTASQRWPSQAAQVAKRLKELRRPFTTPWS
jgi:hypothetical protein